MSRSTKITLIVAMLVTCVVVACGAVSVLKGVADAFGCHPAPPQVSGVQEDPRRVGELMPALGVAVTAHWRWREARPRTCPDLGPMEYHYEGFAVLAAAPTGHPFEPATTPPAVPGELAVFAPPASAWQRSTTLDAAAAAQIWFDPVSTTVYFHYLRG